MFESFRLLLYFLQLSKIQLKHNYKNRRINLYKMTSKRSSIPQHAHNLVIFLLVCAVFSIHGNPLTHDCSKTPCRNQGMCIQELSSCYCPAGFRGKLCETAGKTMAIFLKYLSLHSLALKLEMCLESRRDRGLWLTFENRPTDKLR